MISSWRPAPTRKDEVRTVLASGGVRDRVVRSRKNSIKFTLRWRSFHVQHHMRTAIYSSFSLRLGLVHGSCTSWLQVGTCLASSSSTSTSSPTSSSLRPLTAAPCPSRAAGWGCPATTPAATRTSRTAAYLRADFTPQESHAPRAVWLRHRRWRPYDRDIPITYDGPEHLAARAVVRGGVRQVGSFAGICHMVIQRLIEQPIPGAARGALLAQVRRVSVALGPHV